MRRFVLIILAVLASAFGLATVGAGGEARPEASASVSVATLLSLPDKYEGKPVVVRGNVVANKRSTFPNGRRYHTILVGDTRETVTVFSWSSPNVKVGDTVRVEGTFHIWRYNIRHMIESDRIVPLDKNLAHFDRAK